MNGAPQPQRPLIVPNGVQPAPPASASQRHAAAFAEIKAIETAYNQAVVENERLRRDVDKLQNKVDLLQDALDQERQDGKIYQRKLIRLAASMSGINALTAEAHQIMTDMKEVKEARDETDAERAART